MIRIRKFNMYHDIKLLLLTRLFSVREICNIGDHMA